MSDPDWQLEVSEKLGRIIALQEIANGKTAKNEKDIAELKTYHDTQLGVQAEKEATHKRWAVVGTVLGTIGGIAGGFFGHR